MVDATMKTIALAVAILLAGCGYSPDIVCTSKNGLSFAGRMPTEIDLTPNRLGQTGSRGEPWDCAMLKKVDEMVEEEFTRPQIPIDDERFARYPDLIRGWQIIIMPVRAWPVLDVYTNKQIYVVGLTHCDTGTIDIGNSTPRDSALWHEIAHAVQFCVPKGKTDPVDPDHSNWTWVDGCDWQDPIQAAKPDNCKKSGINQAIDRVTLRL